MKIVYFDLETTGFDKTDQIIQISAKYDGDEFNIYIMPLNDIPFEATKVNGLKVNNGRLFLNSDEVYTVSDQEAITHFILYLQDIGDDVILVAHNCFQFDAPMILRLVQKLGMIEKFSKIVKGFSDTLPEFRNHLPKRSRASGQFKLSKLAEDFLGPESTEGLHNGLVDIRIMEQLIKHPVINVTENDLLRTMLRIEYFQL